MNIRPLYDRVVVRRNEEEETTAGGIVLPGSAKEKPNQGEVVAVGEGKMLDNGELRPLALKVGDTVVFGQYAGSNTIEVDGEEVDPEGISTLAKLPSLDSLRGQLVGLIQAPATQLVRTLAEPGAALVRVLAAYRDRQPAA